MARGLGRRITYQQPRLNAILPDGSRIHASIPPISDIELTIRKFKKNPITILDLIKNKTYSADQLAFLSILFQLDYSVIIAGNTASGKSSTLNSLFSFVPLTDRVLTIEETPELSIPHPHIVKMVSSPEIGIDMRSLVEDSLRMRPDRVVVGEVRTREEVSALIETILSGQARGSYATFHAQSSEEVVKRMVSQGILRVDVSSIDFIVIQRRLIRYDPKTKRSWEERRCVEISELVGGEASINRIFEYSVRTGKFTGSWIRSRRLHDIADKLSISTAELIIELERRKKLFLNLKDKDLNYKETVREIQSDLFSDTQQEVYTFPVVSDKYEEVEERLMQNSEALRDHLSPQT